MAKDIVPDLLKKIEDEFNLSRRQNNKIKSVLEKLKGGNATYEEAHVYAQELGDILSMAFRNNVSKEILPDGRMYYNIAERLINTTLGTNYDLVTDYTVEVQTLMNTKAGYTIKGQNPDFNQDKADGIINKLSLEEDYDAVKWLFDDVIVNFTESIVDDSVKTNAEFLDKTGVPARIVREAEANCCSWCDGLDGVYKYSEAPEIIYHRHRYCRCKTLYYPGDDDTYQDVWDKEWNS